MTEHNYVTLLISVASYGDDDLITNRYCIGIDRNDPLYHRIDVERWADPEMRNRLLSLLCEDWLSDGCCVVGCEQIAGSVQWQRVEA